MNESQLIYVRFNKEQLLRMWNSKEQCYEWLATHLQEKNLGITLQILNINTMRTLAVILDQSNPREYLYSGKNSDGKTIKFKIKLKK